MPVVDNILAYCERNGITVRNFEKQCGLPNSLVARWRDGVCQPSLRSLKKIEERTQIPIAKWIK